MNPIQLHEVTKTYGKKAALNEVTWQVVPGSITALLGPNGAGKSTLLKLVMGLLRPNKGSVHTLGRLSHKLRSEELRQIGFVSESQELPAWMTVAQFLAYSRPLYPTWDAKLEATLMAQFALPVASKLGSLSRGQLMKTALLASMAFRPKLLVLDEPFSGLDPLARDEFIAGILELASSEEWTICISSHDFFEVERLVDHVSMLDGGKIRLDKTAAELVERSRKILVQMEDARELQTPPVWPRNWSTPECSGSLIRFVDSEYAAEGFRELLGKCLPKAEVLSVDPMSLREIFVQHSKVLRQS